MKIKFSLLAAISVAFYPVVIQAEENQLNNIETISIIGSRAPVEKSTLASSVSFINADTIAASGATTVPDLLRTFASVNLSQSGPVGTLTEVRFRGSESNHILVLVDGVEINDIAQGGLVDFAHILVSDVESIELLRGPQSALWGTSAVSGVISITTKKSEILGQHRLSSNIALGTQSTNQIGLSYKTKQNNVMVSANINHYATDGDNIAREGSEDDGYRNTSFNTNITYQASAQHKLTFNARLIDFKSEFDSIDFVNTGLPTDADNFSNGDQLSAMIRWDFKPSKSIWSQSVSYQMNRSATDNFSSDAISGSIFSGGTIGKTQRLNWINYVDFGDKDFINIGLDAVKEDFEQSGPIVFGDPNQQQENQTISILSDGQYEITQDLYTSYSVRADNSDEFDNAESFRIGLNYNFSDNFKVFVSRGKAIKNPSFTERFGFFPGTFTGNSALIPESSYSSELGFIFNGLAQFNAAVTFFDTKLEDEINGFVFDATSGAFTAQNLEETSTRKGLELSLYGDWDSLSWKASYAYLEAKAPSEVELRRSRHSGSATVNYSLDYRNNLYIQADYTGSKQDRFFPPFPNPSQIVGLKPYWLVSANYQYQYSERLKLGIRVDNLLDKSFEDVVGFVGQSRKVLLNLQYQWN
ncbi:MAG: vitamin B12 transporter [Glaciecola sp.]|jgi:vitamin B12 transporter